MSLERLSKFISTGFGLALLALLVTLSLTHYYSNKAVQATDTRFQTTLAAGDLHSNNRELTQLARLYVRSGDERYRRQYYQLWQRGQTFQRTAHELRSLRLTAEEEALLVKIEALDQAQTRIERPAMELRASAGGASRLDSISYAESERDMASTLGLLRQRIYARVNAQAVAAWNKAEQAQWLNVLVQLTTLLAGLLVFLVILRRRLVGPLLALAERMRRLQTGEATASMARQQGLAEVETLVEAFNAYAEVNEAMHRQYWIRGRLGELVQVLQSCDSLEQFAGVLERQLGESLGCVQTVLQLGSEPSPARAGLVHYSLPLLQDGQQLACLDLFFANHPQGAQLGLLDLLSERLSPLLSLLQQRLHNQQLLSQSRQQTQQLEQQALALQATESWYRSIVEVAPEALLVFDQEEGVILANQQSEEIFGYARGDLLGQRYRALVPDSRAKALDKLLERLHADRALDAVEGIARRADGSEFPVELRLRLLPAWQGRSECLCAAIHDLSKHQASERRLRQAHEEQQAIVSAAPYGIALVRQGVIAQANPRLDELLGYAPGEQLQRSPLSWLKGTADKAQLAALEAQGRQVLANGETFRQQLQLCRKDSSLMWASVSGRAIHHEDMSLGSIWIIEDISAQQEAAHEMQQARRLAEDSARIKAEFLANMSHEIRTPMNAIIGMTHLALGTRLDERQRDYLSKVQNSSRHLLGVVNDILDFSKIEAGKLQLDECDFSLAQLLEEAADQVRQRVAAKGLDLLFEVDADVPGRLRGDPLRLRQILLNYLSNAVKFTERGQIRVGVSRRQSHADEVLLHFSVSDSGIGLTAEQTQQLFQSFQQADASITRSHGGTGLGLAIAKQLAALMGGQVGVQSVLGEGSCFWFEAQLQLAHGALDAHQVGGAPLAGWVPAAGTRILLVEDNPLNQQVAAEVLGAIGCHVDIAGNGREALQQLAVARYDLVFMDMQMPVLDGLATTRLLRQQPELAELPVIAMTANAMQRDREACLAAGMNGFVSKPFEPATLHAVLQHWLAGTATAPAPTVPLVSPAPAGLQLDDVDMAAGLRRVLGKRSLYLDLLHRYLVSQEPLLEQLDRALATGALERAEFLVHGCKGVSATIGAQAIAQAAGALEQALRERQAASALQGYLDALSAPLTRLLGQLREQLLRPADSQPTVVDAGRLQQISQQLHQLLDDFDAEAVPYLAQHAGLFRAAFPSHFRQLDAAVQCFDFEQALAQLQQAQQSREAA